MISPRIFQAGALALTLFGLYLIVSKALALTNGHLTYSLDDPYIHLAVAENILRGGYGVNLAEFSAPSSSILYPYLLAGLLFMGFGDWAPLVLGVVGAIISAWVIAWLVWQKTSKDWRALLFATVSFVMLMLAINVFALPVTGMEHTLHTALTLLVIIGI